MRIALIGPVYPYRGGIAYCTTKLAVELGRDFEVEISSFRRQYPKRFYPGGDDRDPSLASCGPSRARYSLDILQPFSWLLESARLRRRKPEVVIFVWWIWVWALPYLFMRSLLPRGTSVILQCHNIADKEPSAWKTALTNAVLRRADALIVHSQSEADEARRRVGESGPPIGIVPLPVHNVGGEIPARADAKTRLGIDPSKPVALFFGHVRPYKGLDVAIEAWKSVGSQATLLVAGEAWWDEAERYRSLVAGAGLEDRVQLHFGFVPDSEIATWFAAADVVVMPYRSATQSGVALTAFHFGRPVIATAVGGVPEVIREGVNGMLVPPEDPEALAAAVRTFFRSGDRSALEEGARAGAREYSWDRYRSGVGEWVRRVVRNAVNR